MADPTPQTWKYGDKTSVEKYVALEDETISSTLIETALTAADAYIDSNIKKAGIPLPTTEYPSSIVQAATFYATATALQPFYTDEDENKKVNFYLSQADLFLENYITAILNELSISGNAPGNHPYSYSQDDVNPVYKFED